MIQPADSRGTHAVVVGASMGGLLAGHILARHFDQVTIVERDHLPDEPAFRSGVPQSRHIHGLLVRGQRTMEQLMPGFDDDLAAAGATQIDWGADAWWFNFGGWKPRFKSTLVSRVCSRELLEWTVRRRTASSAKIRWLQACEVTGLLTDENAVRATGVRLRVRPSYIRATGKEAGPAELQADLVVNASGRDSRSTEWLAALGYPTPRETRVNSFLGYASRCYRPPENWRADWQLLVVSATPPHSSRGAVLVPLEGNRWLVTLAGAARDYPPTDPEGFQEFARSLPVPTIYDAMAAATPLTSVFGYRRTENLRRHYEDLPRFIDGLVTLGDAVCAFNPVYGQGMTVAALGSNTLDACLREQGRRRPTGDLTGLAERFQKRLGRVLTVPWLLATGEDFRYATTEGGRPSLAMRVLRPYMDRMLQIADENRDAHRVFLEVLHLMKPPTALFGGRIMATMVRQALRARPGRHSPTCNF